MIVVPYIPVHLIGFEPQKEQAFMKEHLTEAYAYMLAAYPAWTGLEDGEVVGMAGYVMQEEHKAVVWSLLGENATRRNMLAIHRAVKNKFDRIPAKRIELITRDVPQQHHWAKMLGMDLETPEGMPHYWFDGGVGYLYGKVK